MPVNRYSELLGLDPAIANPDYYQLLVLVPGRFKDADVEEHFKTQMSRLQEIKSVKHKEFLEFLKGEIKNARRILADPALRKQYDADMLAERVAMLQKFMEPLLVEGTITPREEASILKQGMELGLTSNAAGRTIEEMIRRKKVRRVATQAPEVEKRLGNTSIIQREKLLEERERYTADREQRALKREQRVLAMERDQSARAEEIRHSEQTLPKQRPARSGWMITAEVGLLLFGATAIAWLVLQTATDIPAALFDAFHETLAGPIHVGIAAGAALVFVTLTVILFRHKHRVLGAFAFWLALIIAFAAAWPFLGGAFDARNMDIRFTRRGERAAAQEQGRQTPPTAPAARNAGPEQ
jgi:hypothetical protein